MSKLSKDINKNYTPDYTQDEVKKEVKSEAEQLFDAAFADQKPPKKVTTDTRKIHSIFSSMQFCARLA